LNFKGNGQSNSNKFQNVFSLYNILECLYIDHDTNDLGSSGSIDWFILHFPGRNISGIFYERDELLAPVMCD